MFSIFHLETLHFHVNDFRVSNSSSPLFASDQTMAEYSSLLSDLAENITNEDLEQLKSACKEDIPEDQSNNITSSKEWFSYLEKNDKLAQGGISYPQSNWAFSSICKRCKHYKLEVLWVINNTSDADNLSYIEHIFEISRRPDLLTRVIEYRTTVLKISEDDEIDTKLTRIPSAKKYKGNTPSNTSRCLAQVSLFLTSPLIFST